MLRALILLISMFFLIACGGGGNSGNGEVNLPSKPDKSQMAKLNDENASSLAFLIMHIITDNSSSSLLDTGFISGSNNNAKKIKRFNKFIKKECQSGSVDITTNNSELSAVFIFNNCVNSGTLYNGKIKAYYNAEGDYDAIFENVTIKNNLLSIKIPKAQIYFMGEEPHEMKNTYMYVTLKDGKEFKYFNFNSTQYGDEYTFSGYIKPLCLDKYILIKSKGKVYINESLANGEFSISSLNKEIKVNFDRDLTYITLPNKQEETFNYKDILKAINTKQCNLKIEQTIPYRPKSSDFVSFGNDEKNTKIASASFNATVNLDLNTTFPLIKDIYNDLDTGLSCISGDVKEIDNLDTIKAIYKNCKIDANTKYNGEITYKLDDNGEVSRMLLKSLEIKNNKKDIKIKSATVAKKLDDYNTNYEWHIDNLYATINDNEYLNFNLTITDSDKSFDGYVKPKCLGKFVNFKNSSYYYDTNNILNGIYLSIFNEPDYKDTQEEAPGEWIGVNLGLDENSVEIDLSGSLIELSLQDFINKCK